MSDSLTDIHVGDEVKTTMTFTDPDSADAPYDPAEVYVSVRPPSGTVYTKAYDGNDASSSEVGRVWRSAEGVYHFNVSITEGGQWWVRWHSIDGAAADEDSFEVPEPRAYPPSL